MAWWIIAIKIFATLASLRYWVKLCKADDTATGGGAATIVVALMITAIWI